MAKLILLRHGQSAWNQLNVFTGWVDIPLSETGVAESIEAGKKIKDIPFDLIYTSTLVRAQMTICLAMLSHASKKVPVFHHSPPEGRLETWGQIYSEETKKKTIPVYPAWELNERMYGQLQGMNKAEMAEKFGVEQVQLWRRSFDTAPPEGESLAMTAARALPYFKKQILPALWSGKNVLLCAHGNSQRALIMDLEGLSKEEVVKLELATGEPIAYRFEGTGHERIDLSR